MGGEKKKGRKKREMQRKATRNCGWERTREGDKTERKKWRDVGNIKRQEDERTRRTIFIIQDSIAIKKLKREK